MAVSADESVAVEAVPPVAEAIWDSAAWALPLVAMPIG